MSIFYGEMSDDEARALWNLIMVSDPWPLSEKEHKLILNLANGEAMKRGYESWEIAYHEFKEDKE